MHNYRQGEHVLDRASCPFTFKSPREQCRRIADMASTRRGPGASKGSPSRRRQHLSPSGPSSATATTITEASTTITEA